ncbi:hypothetical protein [Silvanigrella sp.]|jgi:hypothetical protein|uniref:hypothetical protein n=1 Tax=Silvanigrella sp. TaxID=2024976 RepID=UPI0037CBF0BA
MNFSIKKHISNISFTNLWIPLLFITSLFYCLFLSFQERKKYALLQKNMADISVIYPKEVPTNSNDNIDLAMALFSIDIDENIENPIYNDELPYRGLTLGNAFSKNKQVLIGKMAFESWGILGSTLAHEIEIHGKQSFLEIEILNYLYTLKRVPEKLFVNFYHNTSKLNYDNLGYGSYMAEKEAYNHELDSKKRFNLNNNEIYAIRYTLENDLI